MAEPRKHHYVPRFYLQHFSPNDGLVQIEKKTGRSFRTNITNVAAIRDYHRIDHDQVADQFELEKNLSRIEDVLSSTLVTVLADGITDADTKARMVELVSLLRMRVPAVKRCIEEHLRQVVRTTGLMVERKGRLPKPPKGFETALLMDNLKIDIFNWACLELMFSLALDRDILEILFAMNSTIIRAPVGWNFVTCDQPVAMFNRNATPEDPYGTALVDSATELSLPLSQSSLLLLSWKDSSLAERLATVEEIEEYNRRTVIMASEYVFAGGVTETIESLVKANASFSAGVEPPQVLDFGNGAMHLMTVRPVMPVQAYGDAL